MSNLQAKNASIKPPAVPQRCVTPPWTTELRGWREPNIWSHLSWKKCPYFRLSYLCLPWALILLCLEGSNAEMVKVYLCCPWLESLVPCCCMGSSFLLCKALKKKEIFSDFIADKYFNNSFSKTTPGEEETHLQCKVTALSSPRAYHISAAAH